MAVPRIYVVIPAFNEARTIAGVVAGVVSAGYRVIVVDDGSRDRTYDVARRCRRSGGAQPPGQSGSGRCVADRIGFRAATRRRRRRDVLALGSRFLGGAVNQPLSRRILLKLATLFTRLTTGLSVTDTHNGLRAMTRRGASAIRLRQNRMAHASEILHQVAESGLKFVEAPVTIEYSVYSLQKGQSMGDALVILTDLFARKLHR